MKPSGQKIFEEVAELFNRLCNGLPVEPLALPDESPASPTHRAISGINEYIKQSDSVSKWVVELSRGGIYTDAPPGKIELLQSLKGLQASLRSLTWTSQQIAEGRFGHTVNFMGEFSDAFNSMARQLESSFSERQKINEELASQVKDLAEARRAMLNIMEDLEESRLTAEAATEAKSSFLANMSHEIRTPMNAIIGLSHLVLKTEVNPKQLDYTRKILSSARSLLGIINDILDFSKIEAGKLEIECIEFNLDQVIGNVTDLTAMRALEKGLELLVYVDPKIPSRLMGDPLRIGQVLVNLASNGVKFTAAGEVLISVSMLEKTQDRVSLLFFVKDTGVGISKEQQKMLFQPFSQADSSTTRQYGGTGLGLTISKRLVEAMAGTIWVESVEKQGSQFFCELELGWEQSAPCYTDMLKKVRGLKILVVDDNATSREILKTTLEAVGLSVQLAESGHEALKILEYADPIEPFNVVLMDWQMPGMDGITASKKIKHHPSLTTIPTIIMVTAFGREEVMQKVESMDLDGFLLKPVTASLLIDSIMTVIGEKDTPSPADSVGGRGESYSELNGLSVLVVEDNEINQQVAREILEGQGVTVTISENGARAIEEVQSGGYDLVLMDVQMPVMDGYEACKIIRSEPALADLPVIAMTANAMAGDREKAMAAGMSEYITKPIEPDQLFRVVAAMIPEKRGKHDSVDSPAAEMVGAALRSNTKELMTLPGVKCEEGLRRIGGNVALYTKLLNKFVDQAKDLAEEIGRRIDSQQWSEIRLLFHSLKGSAGNLGAEEIRTLAERLEQLALSEEKTLLLDALPRFMQKLEEVIAAIESAGLTMAQGEVAASSLNRNNEAMATPFALIGELITFLKVQKPRQSKEILVELMKVEWKDQLAEDMRELDKLIGRYRFKEALQIAEAVENRLKVDDGGQF